MWNPPCGDIDLRRNLRSAWIFDGAFRDHSRRVFDQLFQAIARQHRAGYVFFQGNRPLYGELHQRQAGSGRYPLARSGGEARRYAIHLPGRRPDHGGDQLIRAVSVAVSVIQCEGLWR